MPEKNHKKRQRDVVDVDDEVAAAVREALNADAEAAQATGAPPTEQAEATAKPPSKKARVETNRSLFVRSLPPDASADTLTEFFSQHYPVKHATVVLDPKTKTSRGYGFVTFTDPEDALEAKEKLSGELMNGRRLKLDIAQPRHRDETKAVVGRVDRVAGEKKEREAAQAEARKAPKLIIRNLPWSIKTKEQLETLFRPYGKVKFADLPNQKGKLAGFGFVTLRGRANAEKALASVNGKVVDGRTLAVDWAVDKKTWEHQKDEEHDDEDESEEKKPKAKKAKKTQEEKDAEYEAMDQADKDLVDFFRTQGENLEDEDDEDEDKDEDDDEEEDEDDSVFKDDDEDDDDDSEGGADINEERPKRLTDNSLTLFIRNLPYTATDETLKAQFEKFGAVRYARVVMDKAMNRPAGTGFVCFFKQEDFTNCLKGAPRQRTEPTLKKHSVLQDETVDPEGKYTMDGRILQVTQAVSKEDAARLEAEGMNKKDKDKRRLFLLSEGQISASSPLFKLLTPTEIRMRETSAKQRKKMIQSNPSLHLSLTRLALRNIPHNMTSKDLKALAREAVVGFAKDVKEGKRAPISKEENARGGQEAKEAEHQRREKKKGVVKQAKIVFETTTGTKVNDEKDGKSRGYGFIEYSSHRWALMGLRWLNGHALKNAEGKTQRLIVEFAIENVNVVQRRKAMEARSRENPGASSGGPRPKGSGKDSRPPRGGGKDDKDKKWPSRKERDSKWKEKFKGPAKKDKGNDKDEKAPPPDKVEKKVKKDADAKLALRTNIIARKRTMRKKKAEMRKGK
ncbi:hypothetical protein V8F20_005046 [Naviculisporaceae sp. PSN 640]